MERIIKSDKDVVVIYHDNCEDGFSAGWAAYKKLGDVADFFAFENGDSLKIETNGKKIFFLDVVPKELLSVAEDNEVMVIDHHESTEQLVKSMAVNIFDVNKSGAVLAWNYFHPNEEIPELIKYVQDQDLWRWELPDSKEIYAHISTVGYSFDEWDKLASEIENNRKSVIEKGQSIVKYRNVLVENIIRKSAQLVEFEGHKVFAINSTMLTDEIGSRVYTEHPPFVIIWFSLKKGIKVSLRGNGDIDLSTFAQKYGGGGHRSSCGFILESFDKIPWKVIKKNE